MKRARQQAILDVVAQGSISTQHELVVALADKGFRATQATVSRDIADLGLAKVSRDGQQVYVLSEENGNNDAGGDQRLAELLRDLPIDLGASGTVLVIRAVPGLAHAIAAALDRAHWPGVLGTIAGDDTLFVACADERVLRRIRKRLLRISA